MANDERLARFARGELSAEEREVLERELDARPSLRKALARIVREDVASAGDTGRQGPAERIVIGPAIGEGGMALVRQGVQTALGRPVAVKTLRDPTPSGKLRLYQEARLTARLQHPNIVPVHEVIEAPDGELQVVLKRVEGVRWGLVMRDAEALRRSFGADDPLDWNLGVVIAVCNALAYAHDQGVVHRDVKPSNVMIGRVGEIYLLDWGIGGVFGERSSEDDRPHVADSPRAGSPAFMAPEQVSGDVDALGPWTDTYLVGACLYMILSGSPPHADAHSDSKARRSAIAPLSDGAPRVIAKLVERLLSQEIEGRIVSARELRLELEAVRRHRGALALVDRAEEHARSARGTGGTEREWNHAELAFRAALDAWSENTAARHGLRALLIERAEAALRAGVLDVARERVAALDDPPRTLVADLEVAEARASRARDEASRAVWAADRRVGLAWRGWLIAVFGPLWGGGFVLFALWPPRTALPIVVFLLSFFALGTAAVALRGLSVLGHRQNRANVLGAAVAVGAASVWAIAADHLSLGMAAVEAGILLVLAVVLATVAVIMDRRAAPPAVWAFVCLVVATVAPAHSAVALAAGAIGIALSTFVFNAILQRRSRP